MPDLSRSDESESRDAPMEQSNSEIIDGWYDAGPGTESLKTSDSNQLGRSDESASRVAPVAETTVLRWTVEVNRDDLVRNDITKPVEEWEPNDLAIADRLGLIYAWEVEVERDV